ncbi:MAG: helix-turn-helix domain-containing protein [Candidatus Peregrinibacteria bacterium]|nr:helix-turn-helix domain-containing protein [Candidatus Peregrinibacteria bacterium]
MLREYLCQIGFTSNESKVYLELLQVGAQPVSLLAKRLSMNRTSVWSLLKSLEQKGIVSSYSSKKILYFVANDPNFLIGYIDRKCRAFDYYREKLISVIPRFRGVTDDFVFQKPVVSFFDGLEGVKHIIHDFLNAGCEKRGYISLNKGFWSDRDFSDSFRDALKRKTSKSFKIILPNFDEIKKIFNFNNKNVEVLCLDKTDFGKLFENEMVIYGDKVCILNFDKGAEYGIVIESPKTADMHKMIFDMVWNGIQ